MSTQPTLMFSQGVDEELDYDVDWSDVVDCTEQIASSVWSALGATAFDPTFDGLVTKIWIKDVPLGKNITVKNTVTFVGTPGKVMSLSFLIEGREPTAPSESVVI